MKYCRLAVLRVFELAGVFWTVIFGLSKMLSPFLYVENFRKLLRHNGYKPTSFLAPQPKGETLHKNVAFLIFLAEIRENKMKKFGLENFGSVILKRRKRKSNSRAFPNS